MSQDFSSAVVMIGALRVDKGNNLLCQGNLKLIGDYFVKCNKN